MWAKCTKINTKTTDFVSFFLNFYDVKYFFHFKKEKVGLTLIGYKK
jgi:hypothetical protein